jgi:hypothetical protein
MQQQQHLHERHRREVLRLLLLLLWSRGKAIGCCQT